MMKKRIMAWLMALCLMVTLLPAQTVYAEGVTLDIANKPERLLAGQTYELVANPSDPAAITGVNWDVSDPAVIELTVDGNDTTKASIFCKEAGNATIQISAMNDSAIGDTWDVTVLSASNEGAGGDVVTYGVDVQGMDGYFAVTQNGQTICTDSTAWGDDTIAGGESLADQGYSITDPVYWDPSRVFEGWLPQIYVPDVGNQDIEGVSLLTTAQMLDYPARDDYVVSFVAQWAGEDSDYFTDVGIEGYGGEFAFEYANSGSGTDQLYLRCRENGSTVGEASGLVRIGDPSYLGANYTFGGWLAFRPNDQQMDILVDDTLYTGAQILAMTVPAEDITFYPYWEELGMDHYRYLNTGTLGGDSTIANVQISAHNSDLEASLTVTKNGEDYGTNGTGLFVPGGSNLKASGFDVKNVAFWDSSRQLLGWNVYTYEPHYEEGQYLWDDWVQIPGTSTMSTEEMLSYTIPAGKSVSFKGQWAGAEADYYSGVAFDAFGGAFGDYSYGGSFDIYFGSDYYGNRNWENWQSREGAVISTETGRYFEGALRITNVTCEGKITDEWIQYTTDSNGNWQMVSETPLTTADILQMTVAEDDMVFVAYWEHISWDEYLNYGQGGGGDEGGEGDWGDGFQIPDGVTPTQLQLNVKVTLPGDWTASYYTFTPAESGYYNLCSDATGSSTDIHDEPNGWTYISPMSGKIGIYLEGGQAYQFSASTSMTSQLWIEKALEITNLQILSNDTTKTFQKTNSVRKEALLDGLTVKATYADGTSETVTLPRNYNYDIGGFSPRVIFDFASATGDTAPVSVEYCNAVATYTAKLDSATVTKVELVTDRTPIKVVENTMGSMDWNDSGEYYWYSATQILYSKASFRFTFSDNTTETVKLHGGEAYHGLMINYDESYAQGDVHWTAGNTYSFNLYYGELEIPVSIKIVESPVADITILGEPTNILGHPYFVSVDDGVWRMENFDPTGLRFTIENTDSTTETYAFEDLQLRDNNYYAGTHLVEFDTVDGMQPTVTGPGEIPFYIIIDGAKQTFYINAVERIVEDNQTTVAPSVVEDALANKDQTGGKIVVDASSDRAEVTDGSQNVDSVNLPVDSMNDVAEADADLNIKLDNAEVTFDKLAVGAVATQIGPTAESNITLTVKEVSVNSLTDKQIQKIESVLKNQDQDPLVLDITLKVGDDTISSFPGGKVTIRVPFTPPAGTRGEDYTVFYVPDNANAQVQRMKTTYENGYLVFTTRHFSDYVALSNTPDNTIDDPGHDGTGGGTSGGNGGTGGSTGSGAGTREPAPDTGDGADLFGLTAMLLMSGMLAVALLLLKRRIRV